ncbi:MAG TPA: FlgD immunoglobulin-like domain containing protein, partial [Chthonomonadaceae bacterium]|nr:FlgD immunoglobulin-like domain containing protein [Chthonomonadaceae bacterium]
QSPKGADTFQSSLDVASPPPFSRASMLSVRFPHSDWNAGSSKSGGDFMSDIRRSGAKAQWDVVVNLPQDQQDYTLAWSGGATLPHGTRLTLTDPTNGTSKLMNSTSSYAFRAAKGELSRKFTIVAEPHTASSLFLRNVFATTPPLRGRAAASTMTISYELSVPAETTMLIRQNGRIVRHLSSAGRAATAGVNQMVWDLKDDRGLGMPGGIYTLEVTARTPEGEQTRTVVPITFTR